ncbi:MAG TPA: CPBP family intramembrane glutamic endopeptidase [Chthoniobacterales bacterium]|nr:CPBP family intramembrane glutamic endopeptidase [Chthoniobacterales bacterium]
MNHAVGTDARSTASSSPTLPTAGIVIAIAGTATMDATGLGAFSAFALLPLMLLFWYFDGLSRSQMGFKWGKPADFALALLYPFIVIGLIAITATFAGAVEVSQTNWQKAFLNLAIMTVSTALVAIITEEGFFRGWLWGSLRRRRISELKVLVYTSIAFSAWHISAVTLDGDYRPDSSQIALFLVNAAVIGMIWGMLRWISGSIIVASCSHGLWNGIAYVFFGFGTKSGALGIRNTTIFGPEVGILGLTINALFVILLWRYLSTRRSRTQMVGERDNCLTSELRS